VIFDWVCSFFSIAVYEDIVLIGEFPDPSERRVRET
jgi:hypothetical protein